MTTSTHRWILSVGLIAMTAGAGLAWAPAQPPADQPPPPPQGEPRGRPGQEGGPRQPGPGQRRENVQGLMKTMNRSLRALRSQLDDATKKDENLRLVGEMQRSCVTAKTAGLPADVLGHFKGDEEKAKMAAAFRKDLIAVTRKLLDVEEDLAAGKSADAGKKLDEVIEMRKKAHDMLGVKDDE